MEKLLKFSILFVFCLIATATSMPIDRFRNETSYVMYGHDGDQYRVLKTDGIGRLEIVETSGGNISDTNESIRVDNLASTYCALNERFSGIAADLTPVCNATSAASGRLFPPLNTSEVTNYTTQLGILDSWIESKIYEFSDFNDTSSGGNSSWNQSHADGLYIAIGGGTTNVSGNITVENINRTGFIHPFSKGISTAYLTAYLPLNGDILDYSKNNYPSILTNDTNDGTKHPIPVPNIRLNFTKSGKFGSALVTGNHSHLVVEAPLEEDEGTLMFWSFQNNTHGVGEASSVYLISSHYYEPGGGFCNYLLFRQSGLYKTSDQTYAAYTGAIMGEQFAEESDWTLNLSSIIGYWVHWAFTYNYPNETSIYRNGIRVLHNTTMAPDINCNRSLVNISFGCDYDSIHCSDSTFDEIIFLNDSLTYDQVKTYYESNQELFPSDHILVNKGEECSAGNYAYGYDENNTILCRADTTGTGNNTWNQTHAETLFSNITLEAMYDDYIVNGSRWNNATDNTGAGVPFSNGTSINVTKLNVTHTINSSDGHFMDDVWVGDQLEVSDDIFIKDEIRAKNGDGLVDFGQTEILEFRVSENPYYTMDNNNGNHIIQLHETFNFMLRETTGVVYRYPLFFNATTGYTGFNTRQPYQNVTVLGNFSAESYCNATRCFTLGDLTRDTSGSGSFTNGTDINVTNLVVLNDLLVEGVPTLSNSTTQDVVNIGTHDIDHYLCMADDDYPAPPAGNCLRYDQSEGGIWRYTGMMTLSGSATFNGNFTTGDNLRIGNEDYSAAHFVVNSTGSSNAGLTSVQGNLSVWGNSTVIGGHCNATRCYTLSDLIRDTDTDTIITNCSITNDCETIQYTANMDNITYDAEADASYMNLTGGNFTADISMTNNDIHRVQCIYFDSGGKMGDCD